jgi:hypothetical protein
MSLLLGNPDLASRLILNHHQILEKLEKNGSIAKQFISSLKILPARSLDENLKYSIFRGIDFAERDSAIAERDSAIAERDSALAERDSALAERDSVLNSTIWKITRPYRKLRNLF